MHVPRCICEVRAQFMGVGFLLPPWGFQGLHLGCQALSTESSCQRPNISIFETTLRWMPSSQDKGGGSFAYGTGGVIELVNLRFKLRLWCSFPPGI